MRKQIALITYRKDILTKAELRKQSAELMGLMITASRSGNVTDQLNDTVRIDRTEGTKFVLRFPNRRNRNQQGRQVHNHKTAG